MFDARTGDDILARAIAMARPEAQEEPVGDHPAPPSDHDVLARAMAMARRPVTPPMAFGDRTPRADDRGTQSPSAMSDLVASMTLVPDARVSGDAAPVAPPPRPEGAGRAPEDAYAALRRAMELSQRPVTPPLAFDDDDGRGPPPAAPAAVQRAPSPPRMAPPRAPPPAADAGDASAVLSRAFQLAHADIEPPLTFAPLSSS